MRAGYESMSVGTARANLHCAVWICREAVIVSHTPARSHQTPTRTAARYSRLWRLACPNPPSSAATKVDIATFFAIFNPRFVEYRSKCVHSGLACVAVQSRPDTDGSCRNSGSNQNGDTGSIA